jgi:ribosomal-protein-alanine N-acetyltransferase
MGVANRGGAVCVRSASSADLDAVTLIESVSFSDPWSKAAFASSLVLPHVRFFVAESVDGEVGGGVRPSEGGESSQPPLLGYVVTLVLGDEGEIADLAVAPSARGRGVGGMLLDRVAVESEHLGLRSLYLEVRESNVAARALYESRGFMPVGRRRGYYRSPLEDALLLRRDLGPI